MQIDNWRDTDINDDIIRFVESKMDSSSPIKYQIHNCDIVSTECGKLISSDLRQTGKSKLDFIISHPPYFNIVKFTDKSEDLSNIQDVGAFVTKFVEAVGNVWEYLRAGKYFCLVVGDIYRDGEVVPLGFYLMDAIKRNFRCKLTGIVIKDMVGNRGKLGIENLWRYRALRNGNFILCKLCKQTDKRWDAKNISGNPYSFYEGDENYDDKLGCHVCYQYDPVEYRKQSARRLSEEAVKHSVEYIMRKLYPETFEDK